MPSFLEVNVDGVAEPGTIPPTRKEGNKEGIADNHDKTNKNTAPDEVNLIQTSEGNKKTS